MNNEIKIILNLSTTPTKEDYIQIINALSECMLPINEIQLNDKTVFNNIVGFIAEENKNEV